MQNEEIRIIIIDDHQLVRKSLSMLLESNPQIRVVALCENGQEGIKQAIAQKPEIALVDINMQPVNGFMVTKSIQELAPQTKVIGLSVNNEPKYAFKMLEAGAKGYLTKTSSIQEINEGIATVLSGKIYICEEIKAKMQLLEIKPDEIESPDHQ